MNQITDHNANQSEQTILAIDTCTESCSAALLFKGVEYAEIEVVAREHSQRILPMIDSVLQQAGITINEVDLIAYGRGPGSFTGIRICTSMTQGLALGADKPVVGISSLQTMAQAVFDSDDQDCNQVLTAFDARMGEVYWGAFENQNGLAVAVIDDSVLPPAQAHSPFKDDSDVTACGSGFITYPELLNLSASIEASHKVNYPNAKAMLKLAVVASEQGLVTAVDELAPVYVRDTVSWKKLPGR